MVFPSLSEFLIGKRIPSVYNNVNLEVKQQIELTDYTVNVGDYKNLIVTLFFAEEDDDEYYGLPLTNTNININGKYICEIDFTQVENVELRMGRAYNIFIGLEVENDIIKNVLKVSKNISNKFIVKNYINLNAANVGGKRRKSRKFRKSRKSRKSKKNRRNK